ncbi:MAG TPA: UbiA family prenyltransferase [Fibrobacteria bacterium]|nr:UbiA family prenyltransferase [Fibrobacteria bacterium]
MLMRPREILSFLVHLRPHYQIFILSGAFLAGAVFAGGIRAGFPLQFLSVHVLLFGGVTVYNSYWDRDTGPIGGLRRPPPLAPWTLPASWLMQVAGLLLAFRVSPAMAAVFAASMLFFWLYSRPGIRWKGRPLLSLAAIAASTGFGGFLLGYLHGRPGSISSAAIAGAAGTAAVIVSLFPLSQIYQVEEDLDRRDETFAARYGVVGVRRAFVLLFPAGIAALAAGFADLDPRLGALFLGVGSLAGLGVWAAIRGLEPSPLAYGRVMAVKYAASGLFAAFLAVLLGMQALGWL